ncbi:DNA polymerase III subunit gamma/tau [Gilvimarinus sp. DA14]|uniref:DNA polymerase III subunit gamma/tau n=1 Tax=Gilvimarinus sp. DA14 TaxID=2956798 RepID=UPI0020B78E1F|nr:DNA polymerase III subunit gamma/tau [Gilvimarinus sp. DA14]UTF61184.1 DNA polymerase III subunit gamma/tau [Gilvimarinus sp. DA14]
MSYQVLARKWRPRTFRDLVGQEHVLRALVNALDHDRLHHAYLFTGTRGVGKTTIARILAKCLNCEVGVSSTPCGQCAACVEIAENRFVDLIEVDAASRTKVEDTRELLENVQYAPTRGRYKVYLIDEVHMLSTHSFNALLKTLEEPPPHVKFLLATTDPQRLPVTILSRCLQFNLKNMTPELITGHLQHVLETEVVPFEESALWQLGRAADGSMRDALSLTDQAIAFGSGKVVEAEVRAMLGTIDRSAVYDILRALVAGDGKAVLDAVAQMAEHAPDFGAALADLLSILHRIAIAQALPEAVDNSQGDRDQVLKLATELPPEDVQLFYQTGLLGRRDLPLAPEPRAGLEMVLLRMLAFRPQGVTDIPTRRLSSGQAGAQTENAQAAPPPARQAEPVSAAPSQAPSEHQEPQAQVQATPPEPSPQVEPNTPPAPAEAPRPAPEVSEPANHQAAAEQKPAAQPSPAAGPAAAVNEAPPFADEPPPWDEAPDNLVDQDYPEAGATAPEANPPAQASSPMAAVERVLQETSAPPPEQAQAEPPVQPQASGASHPAGEAQLKPQAPIEKVALEETAPHSWPQIFLGLDVGGVTKNIAANCELIGRQGNQLHFILDENNSSLFGDGQQQRLADTLTDYYGEPVKVMIQPGAVNTETPAQIAARKRSERLAEAVEAVKSDPIVQQLVKHFAAELNLESVQPVDP